MLVPSPLPPLSPITVGVTVESPAFLRVVSEMSAGAPITKRGHDAGGTGGASGDGGPGRVTAGASEQRAGAAAVDDAEAFHFKTVSIGQGEIREGCGVSDGEGIRGSPTASAVVGHGDCIRDDTGVISPWLTTRSTNGSGSLGEAKCPGALFVARLATRRVD